MSKIKSIFPTNQNEIELIKFIAKYKYILKEDTKYFFQDTYYTKRIRKLINNGILRRYKKYLILAEDGYNFLKVIGQDITPIYYQKKYTERLEFISHLGAKFIKNKYITFKPSYEIKEKTVYTESSRKYIGVLKIFGTQYLIYHISNKHTSKYISSVKYDIQKENKYKNIIIIINDINRIKLKDFAFGYNSVIICEDTDEKLDELQYIHQVNWEKIINKIYKRTSTYCRI